LKYQHACVSNQCSTRLRVDRIDTHLRHTNPTALRAESTRDFLLCVKIMRSHSHLYWILRLNTHDFKM
jgi:hypothetical protein